MITEDHIRLHAREHATALAEPGRALALYAAVPMPWPAQIRLDSGRTLPLWWCPTPLMLRERLAEVEEAGGAAILLTPLKDELEADLRARLIRHRILITGPRDQLRQGWAADRGLDPRLFDMRGYGWMPAVLLAQIPPAKRQPVVNGMLSLDHALQQLAEHVLDLPTARPPLDTLLAWLARIDLPRLLMRLDPAGASGLRRHFLRVGGAAAQAMLAASWPEDATPENGRLDGRRALAIGLALNVLPAGDVGLRDRVQAALRGWIGQVPDPSLLQVWGQAAVRAMLQNPDRAQRSDLLKDADRALERLGLLDWVHRSDWAPAGFTRRVELFCQAAEAARGSAQAPIPDEQATAIKRHQALQAEDAGSAAAMVCRILRRLREPLPAVQDLEALARIWAEDLSWLDHAAQILARPRHQIGRMAELVRSLEAEVQSRLADYELAHKALLAAVARPLPTSSRLVGVEAVQERIIAPLLAAKLPVLLLVMDGLSLPVLHELGVAAEFDRLKPSGPGGRAVAVAALPTVTKVSRASLLCGQLTQGGQHDERAGLQARHARAALFHKADLETTSMPTVLAAVADPKEHPLVAVVHNVVDDELGGSTQIGRSWSWGDIQAAQDLLDAALDVGRVVVVTADHGHVPRAAELLTLPGVRSEGSRTRVGPSPSHEGEVVVSGPRVAPPGLALVMLDRRLRYGGDPACHGGLSLAEVFVPLEIWLPRGHRIAVAGWEAEGLASPPWWDRHAPKPLSPAAAPAPSGKGAGRSKAPSLPLFDEVTPQDWARRICGSETMKRNRSLQRQAPPEDQVEKVLALLFNNNGTLSAEAVQREIGQTPTLFLQMFTRLLTVDRQPMAMFEKQSQLLRLQDKDPKSIARHFGV